MIRFKKIIVAFGSMLIAGLIAIGIWVHFNKINNNNLYQEKIIIGTETWPGYIALYVAQAKGYFKEEGLNVEIKRYLNLRKLSEDYVAGKMQARANLTLDAINETLSGFNHQIVLAIDYSKGADAIVATKDIKTIKDFQNKKVAFEKGTLEEFFITWALEQEQMTLKQVEVKNADPQQAMKLLLNHSTEIAVTHEPFLTDVLIDPRFGIVISSSQAPGLITDVLTFRTDFIKEHPDSVRAILRAYFKGLRFTKNHTQEAYQILAKDFGIDDVSTLKKQFEGIKLLDEKDNIISFSYGSGMLSLYANLKKIATFVQSQKKASESLNTRVLIEPKFIREIQD